MSNYSKGIKFEQKAKIHFEKLFGLKFNKEKIMTGFDSDKLREFDLVNKENKIIIECKNITFVKGKRNPHAKITSFLTDVFKLFITPDEYRKIICLSKNTNHKGITIKEYILKNYSDFIPAQVEVVDL